MSKARAMMACRAMALPVALTDLPDVTKRLFGAEPSSMRSRTAEESSGADYPCDTAPSRPDLRAPDGSRDRRLRRVLDAGLSNRSVACMASPRTIIRIVGAAKASIGRGTKSRPGQNRSPRPSSGSTPDAQARAPLPSSSWGLRQILIIEAGHVVCPRRGLVDIEHCRKCPASGVADGLACASQPITLVDRAGPVLAPLSGSRSRLKAYRDIAKSIRG